MKIVRFILLALPMLALLGIAQADKAHVTQVKVRSKSSVNTPDLHPSVNTEFDLGFEDANGNDCTVHVEVTLESGDTPAQMAEKLKAAIDAAMAASSCVPSDASTSISGGTVTVKGVKLPPTGSGGSHSPDPAANGKHPSLHDEAWLDLDTYNRRP